jgi:hypothetical protein
MGGLRSIGGGLQNISGPLPANNIFWIPQVKLIRLAPLWGDLIEGGEGWVPGHKNAWKAPK